MPRFPQLNKYISLPRECDFIDFSSFFNEGCFFWAWEYAVSVLFFICISWILQLGWKIKQNCSRNPLVFHFWASQKRCCTFRIQTSPFGLGFKIQTFLNTLRLPYSGPECTFLNTLRLPYSGPECTFLNTLRLLYFGPASTFLNTERLLKCDGKGRPFVRGRHFSEPSWKFEVVRHFLGPRTSNKALRKTSLKKWGKKPSWI